MLRQKRWANWKWLRTPFGQTMAKLRLNSWPSRFQLAKQQLRTYITLCRHCMTTAWKCLISLLCRGREHKTTVGFFFFAETPYSSEFNYRKSNIWPTERDGISEIKFEAGRVHSVLRDVCVKSRLFLNGFTLIFGPTCQCFFVIIFIQLLLTFEFVRCPC